MKKILIDYEPFGESNRSPEWDRRGLWPASWISGAGNRDDLSVAYRNVFTLAESAVIRFHVTADTVYRLYVDGEFMATGPESGDAANWYYDTFELMLSPGEHRLAVLVLSFGELRPLAKMSVRHGLLLAAEGEYGTLLNTGVGEWEYLELSGLTLQKSEYWIFGYMGGGTRFDGRLYPPQVEHGGGDGWMVPKILYPGANAESCNEYRWPYLLHPATLPEKISRPITDWQVLQVSGGTDIFWDPSESIEPQKKSWQGLAEGVPVEIPAHSQVRCLITLPDYYCAYPDLMVSGGNGAEITLSWAEALFLENRQDGPKGDRTEWRNKYFIGLKDVFISSGGEKQRFYAHNWKSGRFLMLSVVTADDPLTFFRLGLQETRYPLENMTSRNSSSEQLNSLSVLCRRTLEMCMHDTYVDCPYYEQLMYIGDTRLQMLLTYTLSRDARLPEKALRMFAAGRHNSGMLLSRYPSHVPQLIPGFSLLYIGMLHDYAMWRDGKGLIRKLLPVARGIIDAFEPFRNQAGMLANMRTWNFIDWAGDWPYGVPPDGEKGISGILNWMWCYAVVRLAELCRICGDTELAVYYRSRAEAMARVLIERFWNNERGLFADTIRHDSFSEHVQCMAVLSGVLPGRYRERLRLSLAKSNTLIPCTVYFSHYWFETCRELGLDELIWQRLREWYAFESNNLKTLLERPEPSRSDCHAWSSHPLFHFYATMLGIRPAVEGFREVRIEPHTGPLSWLSGIMPHPDGGFIKTSIRKTTEGMSAEIELPAGVPGVFSFGGQQIELIPGRRNLIAFSGGAVAPVCLKDFA